MSIRCALSTTPRKPHCPQETQEQKQVNTTCTEIDLIQSRQQQQQSNSDRYKHSFWRLAQQRVRVTTRTAAEETPQAMTISNQLVELAFTSSSCGRSLSRATTFGDSCRQGTAGASVRLSGTFIFPPRHGAGCCPRH